MVDATDATFEDVVLTRSHQVPVVVDLWAPWCGPCTTLGPIIEQLKNEALAAQPDVKPGKVGTTGYCMGGGMVLRAAGTFPDRIGAAAAFHGGNLATDQADSPHLLAPKIKAKVYVAGADEDAGFPPEQADRLRDALNAAGVDNEVTIYKGAKHGYAPTDMPVYDREASERHWREMVKLFDETLKAA